MKGVNDINWLFFRLYSENPELRKIVLTHSEQVARKALKLNETLRLELNHHEVYIAAILHDIGVVKCYAPEIHAKGHLPYILHGIEGAKILTDHGLKKYARVCSCHTGAGITHKDIIDNNLPLPPQDYLPHSLLEKLICYSDKFFSKSGDLKQEKTLEQIQSQMKKHGEDSYARFMELHRLFSPK